MQRIFIISLLCFLLSSCSFSMNVQRFPQGGDMYMKEKGEIIRALNELATRLTQVESKIQKE